MATPATQAQTTSTVTYDLHKDIDQIDPSPLNPRKTFNQARLEELRDSIVQAGVIEPLVVRPGKASRVELVCGERRYRAAKMAGLTALPVVVRYLTDAQVLELMAIENEQRDDIHPLERAAGYQALMKVDPSFTPDVIAQRIGKSKRWVQLCLQYLTLAPEVQKAFRDGKVTAGHADLIVRLPPSEQPRALAACFEELSLIAIPEDEKDAIAAASEGFDVVGRKGKQVAPVEVPHRLRSVRELGDWIDTHVRADRKELELEFPELQDAVVEAENEGRKVIEISFLTKTDVNNAEYRIDGKTLGGAPVGDSEQRKEHQRALRQVVFAGNWKRADGVTTKNRWTAPEKNPTCPHSVLGIVTFGHGKGQQLRVCVAKKACPVHWGAEQQESTRRSQQYARAHGESAPKGETPAQRATREQAEAKRKRRVELWHAQQPAVMKLVRAAAAQGLTPGVCEVLDIWPIVPKTVKPKDALAWLLEERAKDHFAEPDTFRQSVAKPLNVDLRAIDKAIGAQLTGATPNGKTAAAPKTAAKKPTRKERRRHGRPRRQSRLSRGPRRRAPGRFPRLLPRAPG